VSDLIYEKRDGIAYLTVNRPKRRNTFSPQVVMSSKDAREGPRAFREKRDPVFTGE
jgi:1,4-dihydroxy-2-naphthoyl-CoA synthase